MSPMDQEEEIQERPFSLTLTRRLLGYLLPYKIRIIATLVMMILSSCWTMPTTAATAL